MSTLAEKVAAEIQRWYRIGYEQGKNDAVVHGRWKHVGAECDPYTECYKCSVCSFEDMTGYDYGFCPNCGAKMDGGKQ